MKRVICLLLALMLIGGCAESAPIGTVATEEEMTDVSELDTEGLFPVTADMLNEGEEFLARSSILADFKAVKEGNVWFTTPDYFQISHTLGSMIADFNKMLVNDDTSVTEFTYLFKLP